LLNLLNLPLLQPPADPQPTDLNSITSSFNSTPILAGNTVWFSSTLKVSGLPATPATVHVSDASIDFAAGSTNYHLPVPDARVTFNPGATSASTAFDPSANAWVTSAPSTVSENVFLAGVALPVPGGLPGGIRPITWRASFTSDVPGLNVSWQWAAAAYAQFSSDYNALQVKPVDGNSLSAYPNADRAGTPEAFKTFVVGGARGNGGTNYTGSSTLTASGAPDFVPPPPPDTPQEPASVSGHVFFDNDGNGLYDEGESGPSYVLMTLSWTDENGEMMSLTTLTDENGFYSFGELAPGTYTLTEGFNGQATTFTVDAGTDVTHDFLVSPLS
jgi:hypothetical protein